jgi:hypothetical protein
MIAVLYFCGLCFPGHSRCATYTITGELESRGRLPLPSCPTNKDVHSTDLYCQSWQTLPKEFGGGGFKGFKATSINTAGSPKSASLYGYGGGGVTSFPAYLGSGPNLGFAGRQVGGGNRTTVYGSR